MKRYGKAVLPLLLVGLVIFSLWYTHPVELSRLAEGAELSQCTAITAACTLYLGEDTPGRTLSVRAGEAHFPPLLALAEGRRLSRSFQTLFSGNRVEAPAPMQGELHLFLAYEMPAGTLTIRTIGAGEQVLVQWGELCWQGSFPDMAQWLADGLALFDRADSGADPAHGSV